MDMLGCDGECGWWWKRVRRAFVAAALQRGWVGARRYVVLL
jgi:hypothetical protein